MDECRETQAPVFKPGDVVEFIRDHSFYNQTKKCCSTHYKGQLYIVTGLPVHHYKERWDIALVRLSDGEFFVHKTVKYIMLVDTCIKRL